MTHKTLLTPDKSNFTSSVTLLGRLGVLLCSPHHYYPTVWIVHSLCIIHVIHTLRWGTASIMYDFEEEKC